MPLLSQLPVQLALHLAVAAVCGCGHLLEEGVRACVCVCACACVWLVPNTDRGSIHPPSGCTSFAHSCSMQVFDGTIPRKYQDAFLARLQRGPMPLLETKPISEQQVGPDEILCYVEVKSVPPPPPPLPSPPPPRTRWLPGFVCCSLSVCCPHGNRWPARHLPIPQCGPPKPDIPALKLTASTHRSTKTSSLTRVGLRCAPVACSNAVAFVPRAALCQTTCFGPTTRSVLEPPRAKSGRRGHPHAAVLHRARATNGGGAAETGRSGGTSKHLLRFVPV